MTLREIARLDRIPPESILKVMDLVSEDKNIILFKKDGLRARNPFTVLIVGAALPGDAIRMDGETLSGALKSALEIYLMQR